ncbi:hypothetical protein FSP39_018841 [Pinctada imbricata]|uniref:Uncharacterized protein n=1 Tax=Pinctada imbricata TaxID=66713 RepID=A0AA88XDL3_PINIB|nr:hypothetical protein FSP39_018841 [Pinctada imbricata]
MSDHSAGQSSSGVSSAVPNPWSQVKTDAGLKKLRYFLKELKECGKINKDVEIARLVKEIEKTLETIPQLKSTFSLHAEIDLAIQPLRNENAQLRRYFFIILTLQLQASNTALKRQLNEEKEKMVKMAAELANTHTKLQRLQTEKNKLVTSLSERQTNELQVRQECLSETQKLRGELDSLQRQIRASQIKQQAVERENHILQITVQQRDAEIERQQEIVEAIKDSVSQLLLELDTTKTGADKSYLTNSSFNLQKILHMLDKEHGIR